MKLKEFFKCAMICNKIVSVVKSWFNKKSAQKPEKETNETQEKEEKKQPRVSITDLIATASYLYGATKEIPNLPISEYEKFVRDTMYESGNMFKDTFAGSPYLPDDFYCFMQVLDDVSALKECAESVRNNLNSVYTKEMTPEMLHSYVSHTINNGLDNKLNSIMKSHVKYTVDKLLESPVHYVEYFKNYPQNKLYPWTLFVKESQTDLWDALACAFGKDVADEKPEESEVNIGPDKEEGSDNHEIPELEEDLPEVDLLNDDTSPMEEFVDSLESKEEEHVCGDLEDFPTEDTSCVKEILEEPGEIGADNSEVDDDGDPGITLAAIHDSGVCVEPNEDDGEPGITPDVMGNVAGCVESSEEEPKKKKREMTQEQRDRRNASRRKRYAELKAGAPKKR